MAGELILMENCASCGKATEADAKFCSGCGKPVTQSGSSSESMVQTAKDFAQGTALEVKNLGIEALKSEAGKKIAAGAAMGAAAGLVIPLVGPAIGATLGAGIVAFSRLTK